MRNAVNLLALLLVTAAGVLASPGDAAASQVLQYRIVNEEPLKKGASLDPLIRPKYVLMRVDAALVASAEISEEAIRATLVDAVAEVRRRHSPDAVTVFLYESPEHVGKAMILGRAEWWPKGHSLSPENARNIADKGSYELEYKVMWRPRSAQGEETVTRLPKQQRVEVFRAMVKAEDRADAEAERKYPTDASKIPMNQLATYDFKEALFKNNDEAKRLREKYLDELAERFKLTREELKLISQEAFNENWPLPD